MMYRYFIFDMDGTLLDSTDGIIAALQEMEKRMVLAPLSMAELRGFIGPPLKESFIKYYGAAPEETDEMTRVYRDCYLDVGTDKTRVFDGAFELLRKIRALGYKSAIATLKQHQLATKTLQSTGMDKLTDHICLDLDNSLTDKAGMINECLTALGCADKREAVMVGDSPNDGQSAAAAGVDFIPLMCGEGFKKPGAADSVPCAVRVGSLKELADYIS